LTGGLWLGGHYCQEGAEACFPRDRFDVIVSLHKASDYWRYESTNGAKLLEYRMPDSALSPAHHDSIMLLAEEAARHVQSGRQVLVRCRAGINRSALVAGLALVQLGYRPDEAVFMMRRARSPYVLFNDSFAAFLQIVDKK
jgi:protein-tyrosine phosphatase